MSDFDPMGELPEGFAKALAQVPAALDAFTRLDQGRRTAYATRARQAHSKAEMTALVAELSKAPFAPQDHKMGHQGVVSWAEDGKSATHWYSSPPWWPWS